MQSRAFLSQLSVTGDESGFFYAFSKVGIFLYSRPLKDALLLNSQHINAQFALKYLQVFVSLQSETCRYYDKKDLSAALLVQFVGRPTEPHAPFVPARQ